MVVSNIAAASSPTGARTTTTSRSGAWAWTAPGPVSVTATGVKPSDKPNSYNCHPHFAVTYTYADGTHLVTTSDGENGNRFIGDKGWIFVSRERIEASDKKLLDEPLPRRPCGSTSRTTTWATSSTAIRTPQAADLRRRGRLPLGDGLPPGRDRAAAGHSARLGPQGRALRRPPRRQGQRHDLARNALALAARGLINHGERDPLSPLAKGGSGGWSRPAATPRLRTGDGSCPLTLFISPDRSSPVVHSLLRVDQGPENHADQGNHHVEIK